MAITDYKLLSFAGVDTSGLVDATNAAIADGWQPLGAPFLAERQLHQAVVKGAPDSGGGGGSGPTSVAWDDVTDKPTVIAAGDTAADARSAIGAGTPYSLPAASNSALGGVRRAASVSDSEAEDVADLVSDFNALLASLRAAGTLAE